jgi:hypothetical protein
MLENDEDDDAETKEPDLIESAIIHRMFSHHDTVLEMMKVNVISFA